MKKIILISLIFLINCSSIYNTETGKIIIVWKIYNYTQTILSKKESKIILDKENCTYSCVNFSCDLDFNGNINCGPKYSLCDGKRFTKFKIKTKVVENFYYTTKGIISFKEIIREKDYLYTGECK